MVWEASLEPRVVEVNMLHHTRPRAHQSKIAWRTTSIPAQLAATSEARRVLLRFYHRLYFACPLPVGDGIVPPKAMVYLHPELDVLSQDCEAIIYWEGQAGVDRVRRPGVKARVRQRVGPDPADTLTWDGDFYSVFHLVRPLPWRFLDPLRDLRHVQVNLHILKSSRRNGADSGYQTTTMFMQTLLHNREPNPLQTITLKVTWDLSSQPTPASSQNMRPVVYRIVRSPTFPLAGPSVFFTAAQLLGQQSPDVSLANILLAEGAIFTRQPQGPFAALRVIDPNSVESYYDIDGEEWPGAAREDMWRRILTASPGPQNIDIVLWLTRLIGNAPGPQYESPWGICGVHYGMGEAKGCINPMGRANWRW